MLDLDTWWLVPLCPASVLSWVFLISSATLYPSFSSFARVQRRVVSCVNTAAAVSPSQRRWALICPNTGFKISQEPGEVVVVLLLAGHGREELGNLKGLTQSENRWIRGCGSCSCCYQDTASLHNLHCAHLQTLVQGSGTLRLLKLPLKVVGIWNNCLWFVSMTAWEWKAAEANQTACTVVAI